MPKIRIKCELCAQSFKFLREVKLHLTTMAHKTTEKRVSVSVQELSASLQSQQN